MATYHIGGVTERYSFAPVLDAGSIIPLIGEVDSFILRPLTPPRAPAGGRPLGHKKTDRDVDPVRAHSMSD